MRERWRAKARAAVRRYPELVKAEADLRSPSLTPNYNGMPSGSEATRKTEILALRELPPYDRRDLEAVRTALRVLERQNKNADLRYQLIDIVYWRRTHSVEGAAMRIHVSQDTAREWDQEFIKLVDAFRRR